VEIYQIVGRSASVHYVRIQHSFLLQIMRHRVLGQQRRFQLYLSADPLAFGVGLVGGVVTASA